MAKVVVTGGAGFLGSHVASKLAGLGDDVAIIDDFSSGMKENLRDLGVRSKVTVGDLRNYDVAKKGLRGADAVYHFAAEVGSASYLHGSNERELYSLQANLVIDANVFKAALENGVKMVIFASSVSVYPFDEQLKSSAKFREEDSERKVNPEGGYGWAKYIAEKQLELMPGVSYGIARIFHAYGKNIYLRPDRSQVIASLIRKAVMYPKEDFVVWGDGSQKRCFVYIDDAMDAILRLEAHVKTKGSLTVNIGTTEEVSVREVAERVTALSGKRIPLRFDPSKPTGAKSREPDLARVKGVLGWSPTTSFADGLARTFEWAEGRLLKG